MGLAYNTGKSIATHPLRWLAGLIIAVGGYQGASWYAADQNAAQAKADADRIEAARALGQRKLRERCVDNIEPVKAEANSLLKKGDASEAIKVLNGCAGIMTDTAAIATLSRARDEFAKQQLKAEQIAAAAEAKRKKSEGVKVGMSKADVLASSWGKPEKVNTTTTSNGTREQWVYGSGNYLYFVNGVLATIQN